MRVLTIRQPWASLVAGGLKTIETRATSTNVRGRIAIHAGAHRPVHWIRDGHQAKVLTFRRGDGSWDALSYRPLEGATYDGVESGYWFDLPLGAIVATADLHDCIPILDLDDPPGRQPHIGIGRHTGRLGLWRPTIGHYGGGAVSGTFDDWEHEDIDHERPYGDFTPRRFAWMLRDITLLDEPVPFKGGQGWSRTWTP
jgi:hypothetical protein